ncbi:MAG TPA: SRPBCC family protein [Vicinamibacterales bacterium]|nr:SRPBCC family protein [Vicinamibacterales bacterium]
MLSSKANVSPAEQRLSAVAAITLALYGIRRRGGAGVALAAAGGFFAVRALTGFCPVYRWAGATRNTASTKEALGGSRGIHVLETVTIARPVADVYRFWRDLSNLPRFMRHLQSVTTDGVRSHWVARGPLNTTIEWDAEINHEEENKVIGWRTLEGARVVHAGSVTFNEMPGGGAQVRVKLQYQPPAGRLGGAVARLLGDDPSRQIREDLQRVKGLLETGTPGPSEAGPLV